MIGTCTVNATNCRATCAQHVPAGARDVLTVSAVEVSDPAQMFQVDDRSERDVGAC